MSEEYEIFGKRPLRTIRIRLGGMVTYKPIQAHHHIKPSEIVSKPNFREAGVADNTNANVIDLDRYRQNKTNFENKDDHLPPAS